MGSILLSGAVQVQEPKTSPRDEVLGKNSPDAHGLPEGHSHRAWALCKLCHNWLGQCAALGTCNISSLGTNVQTLHLGVMVATTFLCLGAFVAYAPFTLIGLGLPYLTKRYLLRRADVRYSLLPSTLLTIIILWSAYLLRLHFALDTNALAIILFLPLVLMTCHLPSRKKVSQKTTANYEAA